MAVQRHGEEEAKHPLLTWIALRPGDAVSLHVPPNHEYIGTVECSTTDGLIIWIRDNLNDRKLFHFYDCKAVRLIQATNGATAALTDS